MPSNLTCPEDADLLALAMGDPVSNSVTAHVTECTSCQARFDCLKAELVLFRVNGEEVPFSSPILAATLNEPNSQQAVTNAHGQVDHQDTTAPREPPNLGAEPPSESKTDPDGEGSSTSSESSFPAAIGKYLVVGRFPHSGQAEVFRVVHPQLHQERVLKLAKAPVGPDGRSEIVEEGKILAELEHPHLIRVYDLDFLGDRPYLVMEYIRGRNLEQYAGEHSLSSRQIASLVAKVAGAAGYTHRRGIVHRDIKPRNILVDEAGEPRLIDFGMARLRTAWSDDRKEPDGGTFAFMAPEQARIESPEDRQKVGPRSDVFAIGATLYFLLTGKAPFRGENWREAWDRARRCDFDPGALNDPKVPAPLRRICLKAMAADPADRFASAEELARALDSFRRRPSLIAAGALTVLISAMALAAWQYWPDRQIPSPPPNPRVPMPKPVPLAGELTVRVWSRGEGGKRGLRIDDPGALPLLAGELIHLEATLNQPAYAYLLYLDGQGKISLLYPRTDGKFGSSPAGDTARETVHSPEALDDGLKMRGPGGLETALLLVRRTPLPANMDLAASIGPLPPSPLRDLLEVAKRGGDEGQPIEALRVDLHRGIDEDQTVKIDDPLLQLMERLRTRNQFDVIKAVRFAYRG